MRKKIWLVVILLACCLLTVTGCGINVNITDKTDDKVEISLGSWDGNTYENEFLSLTYTMPSDWTRYSDEQIKDLMELGSELTDASELSKKLAELTSVTYMMTTATTGSNIILMSEKPIISVSEQSYAEQVKTQLESQTAITYQLSDITTETVDGREFVTLEASVETLKQKYYIYKVDDYVVSVILTAVSGDDINTLIEQFEFK